MFNRISNSWSLAMSSWRVLMTDTQLLLFPLVSGIALLFVLASFGVPLGIAAVDGVFDKVSESGLPLWMYPVIFLFYFCNYFVIVFCNAAMTSCALMRLRGETPRVNEGFRMAIARLPQIAAWSLVSATVGFLLKLVESMHEKLGEVIAMIVGTAWSIMTFFVVPVLVVEKLGPFDAVSRSIALLKETWGESLVGKLGIGVLMFVLAIPGVILLAVGGSMITTPSHTGFGIAIIVVAVIYFIGLSLIGSALNSIFLAAVYQYAVSDRVPEGFDREVIAGAFHTKGGVAQPVMVSRHRRAI